MRKSIASLFIAAWVAAGAGSWRDHARAAAGQNNPLASDPAAVAAGAKLYARNCASCHGRDGEGRGHNPALAHAAVSGTSDGELFWLLRNGSLRHGMPSWSHLPEEQRWQIIAFLRSLM